MCLDLAKHHDTKTTQIQGLLYLQATKSEMRFVQHDDFLQLTPLTFRR